VASKVTECFEGTREELLLYIETWRVTDSSAPIFILDGIAGIGKTTVVKTFSARAAAQHRLAASWFFSRDQQDRKSTRSFVGTLAFQLASYHPILRERIVQALMDHPDILQKEVRTQFDTLIHKPLQAALRELGGTHAISIDAIDECNVEEATEVLSILLSRLPQLPQLRVLITCRPERPFRLLLQKHRGTHVFHLHDIENSVVESDIRLYINHRLSPEQIDKALPDLLPPPWRPSAKEKEALVQMSGKLFIVAATAINFILDPRRLSPAKQMRQLLSANTGSGLASSSMDRLYTQVLRAAIPDPVDDWFDDYKTVVGAIVVAADVLPVQSLAALLDKKPNDIIGTLSHLHSLIAPTNHNEAFRVHHKSFPDFVTDPARCSIDPRLFIDPSAQHLRLARGCLRIMVQMLKHNICEIPPSDCNKSIHQFSIQTRKLIAPELAYACAHYVYHLQEGLPFLSMGEDDIAHLKMLVDEHLLSWLEVLAFTGRYDSAWHQVNLLCSIVVSAP
jgi:NACHT domain